MDKVVNIISGLKYFKGYKSDLIEWDKFISIIKIDWGYFRFHEILITAKNAGKNWKIRDNLIDRTQLIKPN